MFSKVLLCATILLSGAAFFSTPRQAEALSVVAWFDEFHVQFRCPRTGQWRTFQRCISNQQLVNAMYASLGRGYTTRFIHVGRRQYVAPFGTNAWRPLPMIAEPIPSHSHQPSHHHP